MMSEENSAFAAVQSVTKNDLVILQASSKFYDLTHPIKLGRHLAALFLTSSLLK